jgi:hypothetical protein
MESDMQAQSGEGLRRRDVGREDEEAALIEAIQWDAFLRNRVLNERGELDEAATRANLERELMISQAHVRAMLFCFMSANFLMSMGAVMILGSAVAHYFTPASSKNNIIYGLCMFTGIFVASIGLNLRAIDPSREVPVAQQVPAVDASVFRSALRQARQPAMTHSETGRPKPEERTVTAPETV